jgi:hypothetical protein
MDVYLFAYMDILVHVHWSIEQQEIPIPLPCPLG